MTDRPKSSPLEHVVLRCAKKRNMQILINGRVGGGGGIFHSKSMPVPQHSVLYHTILTFHTSGKERVCVRLNGLFMTDYLWAKPTRAGIYEHA